MVNLGERMLEGCNLIQCQCYTCQTTQKGPSALFIERLSKRIVFYSE